ncbi:MAG: hypothetical protein PHI71_16140 [Acidiphilium sp.]|nr:hypothetical protein [Acidiphilium sp.]
MIWLIRHEIRAVAPPVSDHLSLLGLAWTAYFLALLLLIGLVA